MTPAAPAMTDAAFALALALLMLAPLAIAGVALINTGLGRSRSATQGPARQSGDCGRCRHRFRIGGSNLYR